MVDPHAETKRYAASPAENRHLAADRTTISRVARGTRIADDEFIARREAFGLSLEDMRTLIESRFS